MRASWQQKSRENHRRFVRNAQKKGKLMSETEIINFLALAICGESGELANLIKKTWRGDKVDSSKFREEIADIRIYLEHLANHLRIDLDEACEEKVRVVSDRLLAKEAEESAG